MRAGRGRVQLPVVPLPAHREAELEREGWIRRFVTASPRLEEMIELYQSLGLDVRMEPLNAGELDDDCADCVSAGPAPRIIYTRGRK
jgi:hypothetical protein